MGAIHFDRDGVLYAGTGSNGSERDFIAPANGIASGVFASRDGGLSWEWRPVQQRLFGALPVFFECLTTDPFSPSQILAVAFGWILRSSDGGTRWEASLIDGSGSLIEGCGEIVADPRHPGVYYQAQARNVMRSEDHGESWKEIGDGLPSGSIIRHVALDARGPSFLYVGVQDHVWRSEDEGASWREAGHVGASQSRLLALTMHPQTGELYAAVPRGVYRSLDRAQTWDLLLQLDGQQSMARIRFDPHSPERVFLVRRRELRASADRGMTWESIGDGLAEQPWFYDVAVDPADAGVVLSATTWGVYRRALSGTSTAVGEATDTIPRSITLAQNYPNPFNAGTAIQFTTPVTGQIDLSIYNLLGQKVRTLAAGPIEAGIHTVHWDGRDGQGGEVASGVYVSRLRADSGVRVRKLLVLR